MVKELNRHPDEGDIEKYAMGLLREVEVAGFEEHLLICEECQRHLAEADEYVVAMRGAVQCSNRKGQGQPRGSRWKALRAISALAAVAVLMLGIGWWSGKSSLTGSAPFAVSLQATRGA